MLSPVKGGLVTAFLLAGSLVLGACAQKAAAPSAEKEAAPGAETKAMPTGLIKVGERPKAVEVKDRVAGVDPITKEKVVRGGVFHYANRQYRSFFFPQETHTHIQQSGGVAYNTILQIDPYDPTDTVVAPDLAERWEISKDGLAYTLHFRKDVKWHDGVQFTAADAKFNLDLIRDPPPGVVAVRKTFFQQIDKVDLLDDYTMVITLKRPQSAFLLFLAGGWNLVLPKHKLEADLDWAKRNIMGTGPFKIKNLDFNVGLEFVRNEEYFKKGLPYLDGFRYTIMEDAARNAAFRVGRIDTNGLDAPQIEAVLKEIPEARIYETAGISVTHFRFNHTKAPFNNLKLRQALSLVADRQAIIKVLSFGRATLPFCALPAGGRWAIPQEELIKLPGYRPDKTEDIKRAKELMAGAGYPEGFRATMLLGQNATSDNMGLMLKDQVRAIGIELETRKLEFTAFITAIDKLEFEIVPYGFGSSFDDPDDPLTLMYQTGGGRNYGKFSDPEVDRLIDAQSREPDPVKRKKLAEQACLEAAVKNVAQLEVQSGLGATAYQPWVKGYIRHHHSSYNDPYKHEHTWIDPKLKR